MEHAVVVAKWARLLPCQLVVGCSIVKQERSRTEVEPFAPVVVCTARWRVRTGDAPRQRRVQVSMAGACHSGGGSWVEYRLSWEVRQKQ